jgi:UDP-N-acetylglucosamine 2-epimerase
MDVPEIVVLLGTRPEAIKLAPVVLALREAGARCFVLASGQHRELLAGALSSFGLSADRDLALMRDDQPLNDLQARMVEGLGRALDEIKPRLVVVQGDTATALAGALAAFHLKLPCAHVEAGLRSGRRDAPWPEELYRQVVDRLCTRLYAPTEGARQHLLREGLDASSIVVTGQTGVDAALLVARQTRVKPAGVPALAPRAKLIYATAHRRESFGKLAGMVGALAEIVEERADVEVVLPLHPNPEVRRQAAPYVGRHSRLHLIEPVDYADSIWLLTRAALCVTDSGGIQEEAPSFGLPVLVMREVTERPEGIDAGFLRVTGTDGGTIAREIRRTLDDAALRKKLSRTTNPYGDGKAAVRIAADIERALGGWRIGRSARGPAWRPTRTAPAWPHPP